MKYSLSRRSDFLHQSEIRAMSIECEKISGINLSQGVCDLETPRPVAEGAKEAIDNGINQYTRYDGLQELREAISEKMRQFNKIKADPNKNIIVSAGSTGAFYSVCMTLLNPGDEVILFEPFYGYHLTTLLAVNAEPVYVRLNPPDWSFNTDDLEKVISKKTRGIMICTPANPSGKVFSRKELEILSEFCIKHNLLIFTDEIYEYFVYDNYKHISPGSLKNIKDRTITISGYSKTYSITGWRVGYAVCDEKIATTIGYINDLIYVCAPSALQVGVADGIKELPGSYYSALCKEYEKKRNKICGVLNETGLMPYIPQGAYYVLVDASRIKGKNSKEKAMYLLRKTGVATVPGSAFYHDKGGENLLRICFAKNDRDLNEACNRLLRVRF